MTSASAYNPAMILVRLLALAAFAYITWIAVSALVDFFNGPLLVWEWLTAGVLALPIGFGLLLCGWSLIRPARSHLTVFMVILGISAGGAVWSGLGALLRQVLTQNALETAEMVLFWPVTIGAIVPFLVLDRWIAKRAGLAPADDRRWWRESNIRGLCTLTAWGAFFILSSLAAGFDDSWSSIVKPEYETAAPSVFFLVIIFTCVLHAKITPLLLMKLTGVEIGHERVSTSYHRNLELATANKPANRSTQSVQSVKSVDQLPSTEG